MTILLIRVRANIFRIRRATPHQEPLRNDTPFGHSLSTIQYKQAVIRREMGGNVAN